MQAFDDIFGLVSGYKPYHMYVLYILLIVGLAYLIYRILKKLPKKVYKEPLSLVLREKFATLEMLRTDVKRFSVLASMLIKEFLSYKMGVDLRSLTTRELEDFFSGLDEVFKKRVQDIDKKEKPKTGLDFFEEELFDRDKMIMILTDLDHIKYRQGQKTEDINTVLFYVKDIFDDVLQDILKTNDESRKLKKHREFLEENLMISAGELVNDN